MNGKWRVLVAAGVALAATGCTTQPRQPDDLCAVFAERRGWYQDAREAEARWQVSVPMMMAFVRHESAFIHDAQPPRRRLLWLIPLARPSSAYGYAQATDGAWDDYRRATGRRGADRDDMGDALDFIGWYADRSQRRLRIRKDDVRAQYLAYHEGHAGYESGRYRRNTGLQQVAARVAARAEAYGKQLALCAAALRGRSWWPF